METRRKVWGAWALALLCCLWALAAPARALGLSDPAKAAEAQAKALLADGPAVPDLGQLLHALAADAAVQVRLQGDALRAAGAWERLLRLDTTWPEAHAKLVAAAGVDPLTAVAGAVVVASAPDIGRLRDAPDLLVAALLPDPLPGDGYAAAAALATATAAALDLEAAPRWALALLCPSDDARRAAFAAAFLASPQAQQVPLRAHALLARPHPSGAQVEYAYLWPGGLLWGVAPLTAWDEAQAAALAVTDAAAALRRLSAAASAPSASAAPPAARLITPTDGGGSAQVTLDLSAPDTLRLDAHVTLTPPQAEALSQVLLGLTVAKAAPLKALEGAGIPAPMRPLLALLLKGLRAERPTPLTLTLTTSAPLSQALAEVDALLTSAASATCAE